MNQGKHGGGEQWATRIGVILAVSGSAIGLGNFLRFPGQAAQYGGGAFMIPYIVAFLILGLPIAWVEWSMGRYGGARGYNSAPGVFRAVTGNRYGTYMGILGPIIPVMIYMYYVFIEAWCLGYAWYYLTGRINKDTDAGAFFEKFTGIAGDGTIFTAGNMEALAFLVVCFVLNFFLIYRGLNKGIEWFCKYAMPALFIIAFIVLIRVLTLGAPVPEHPNQNVMNGLGYMWNPVHQAENLAAGDEAMKALIMRSSVTAVNGSDDADGYATFKVLDAKATQWALEQAGYARNDAKSGGKAAKDAKPLEKLAGRWEAKNTAVAVRIEPDGTGIVRGFDPEAAPLTVESAKDAALKKWLTMLPREVAEPERGEETLAGFAIEDETGFTAALTATGWEAGEGEPYTHESSRLRIEVDPPNAVVAIPTFGQTLSNPEIWLAAAGQIFFSLSVGFGIVITYSSYMKRDDDVALSSVTAAAGNGFAEVVLAGLTIIPATFIFLGVSTVANPPGTFGMGFVALPNVFVEMPAGRVFGFLFFFLLFLAAVTSSLSMLQPAIALLEEGLGIGRKASVALLGFMTAVGAMFIVYFSGGALALDTVDFWVGTFCIYVMATIQVVAFAWILGMKRGMEELNRGALMKVPGFVQFVIKYISPTFLLVIFALWVINNAPGRIEAILTLPEDGPPVVQMSIGLIVLVAVFFVIITMRANARWDELEAAGARGDKATSQPEDESENSP